MKLSIEDITTQLSHINTLISQEISESDYPTMLSYLNELSAWQGNSGKCVADAEWYYHEELEKVFDELDKTVALGIVISSILGVRTLTTKAVFSITSPFTSPILIKSPILKGRI